MSAEKTLRTLIVDDEPLAVERLQILCAQIDRIMLVGTASDGEAAIRLIKALAPDMVLLDVSMPEMDGIAVAAALEDAPHRPAIIFCTAFDQFAVEAFNVAAVDYLLKPVAPDRLARAIDRVADKRERPREVATPAEWLEEFWVPHRSEVIRIAAASIDRIDAERDYMRLHTGARSFLLHQTITELERRLDPAIFIRLHRSTIVRRNLITKLRHDGLGNWYACLDGGSEVRIGRSYLVAAKAFTGR